MRLSIFILIVIVLICFSNAFARENKSSIILEDTTLANEYFEKAKKLKKETQYDSSTFYFEKSSVIYEKEEKWTKYVKCYNQVGDNFKIKGEYDKAMTFHEKALETAKDKLGENHIEVAETYYALGNVLFFKGRYDEALNYYDKSLEMRRKAFGENHLSIAQIYHNSGSVYVRQGKYNEALNYFDKSLKIKREILGENNHDVAKSYNNIGAIYYFKNDYDSAMEYYQKTLDIERKILGENHPDVSIAYGNVGTIYWIRGDYDTALEYYQKSLTISLQLFGDDHPSVATLYTYIGMLNQGKNNYEEALKYYNNALIIRLEKLGKSHFYVSENYSNIANVYYLTGKFDKSIEYYHEALEIQIENFGENHTMVLDTYHSLGICYAGKNDEDKALDYYQKSLTISHDLFGQDDNIKAWNTYQEIGKLYAKQKDYRNALNYIQKSLVSLTSSYQDKNIYNNPPLENIHLKERFLLTTLTLKAEIFENLYSTSQDIKDMKQSVSTYELALKLIDQIRNSYKAEGSQLFLAESAYEIYNNAVGTSLKLYQITKDEVYKNKVFTFAEKSKAGVLLQAYSESKAREFAGIPDTLLENERQLKIDLTFYDKNLTQEQDKGKKANQNVITYWQDKHFMRQQEYDKLITQFETNYPDYYNLKYQVNTTSIQQIQQNLSKHSALIEFFVGDENICIFTITHNNYDVTTISIDSTFDERVNMFYRSIKKLDFDEYLESSHYLYTSLVEPIKDFIKSKDNLIIIPDGNLYYIPFEALLVKKAKSSDFTKLEYLIKDFDISYHYSSTLMLNSKEKTSSSTQNTFLGFAPVFNDKEKNGYIAETNFAVLDTANTVYTKRSVNINGQTFSELPATENEISGIIELLEKKKKKGIGYFHQKASEENFKTEVAKNYRYIHVATHGFINTLNPRLSGLVFSQPQDSTFDEDGVLYSGESYNLDLDTELLVLSSCESGVGQIVKGEGMMARTRGLLYSGADNIVFSLWKVDDKPTSELMIDFYKHILSKKDFSSALRKAKLNMIKNKYTAFPKNWAGFVLIGE